jgi:hypothetical protein
MPKEWAMTQISRPFQIALLAMGLFAALWFFVLQGHSASTSGSGTSASAPSAPAQPAKTHAAGSSLSGSSSAGEKAAAPSPVYHGSAPGVEGLTRAITKAHEAVATSQRNAKALEEKSAQASSPSSTTTPGTSTAGSTTTHPATAHVVKPHARSTHPAAAEKVASPGASKAGSSSARSVPRMQATVEAELKQGKIVAVLFWNAKGSVDQVVQRELNFVGRTLGGGLAIHDARAAQVGSFGSITRNVQVLQTPTILIVNKHGQTTALTGLTDSFAIQQAIAEAKHA